MHISLEAETLWTIFGFPFKNSILLSLVTTTLLVGSGLLIARSLKLVPVGIQHGAELIVDGLLDFTTSILGDRKTAVAFFPLIATIFLFILLNNWIGVLPGTGSVGFHEGEHIVPLFRSANSDLNTTLALAFIAMASIHIAGIAKLGFFKHMGKFFVFTHGPIHFFVGLLELVGEFAKVLSFSFRLFGNVFAGEVLLVVVMTLAPILAPTPFLLLEFFVGFIQALVFTMLTLVFLKVATAEEAGH